MVTKKAEEKKTKISKKKKTATKSSHYFYAVGRRKTAIARVKIFPTDDTQNKIMINKKKIEDYFPLERLANDVKAPLALAGEKVFFKVEVNLSGGGTSAQAGAARLGIARALVIFDETLKKSLKSQKFLTRDSRKVERKKPGLKKARKSPQWAKR